MKPKIEEGQMLRIRLECLKLAVQMAPPGGWQRLESLEIVASRLQCYVLIGAMQEPEPVQQRYKPVEMTDAGGL